MGQVQCPYSAPTLTGKTTDMLPAVSNIRERRRKDGSIMTDRMGQTVWEVRVYVGRDPVTKAPRQVCLLYTSPSPRDS